MYKRSSLLRPFAKKKVWNDDDGDDGANLKLVRRLMGHL